MSNKIEIGCEFLKKIAFEISKIAELVACTLGPRGRNVVIEKGSRVILTSLGTFGLKAQARLGLKK